MAKPIKEQIRNLYAGQGREAALTAFPAAQEGLAALEHATNVMGNDVEAATVAGLVAGLDGMHPHQQAKLVFAMLTALGELPRVGASDGRNVHAHRACDKLRGALAEQIYWA
jgi:hypothetical protein